MSRIRAFTWSTYYGTIRKYYVSFIYNWWKIMYYMYMKFSVLSFSVCWRRAWYVLGLRERLSTSLADVLQQLLKIDAVAVPQETELILWYGKSILVKSWSSFSFLPEQICSSTLSGTFGLENFYRPKRSCSNVIFTKSSWKKNWKKGVMKKILILWNNSRSSQKHPKIYVWIDSSY